MEHASVSFSLFWTPGNSTGPYVKWAPLVMVLVKSLRKNLTKILAKNVTNLMPLKPVSTVLSPLCSWKAESKFNEDIGERRYNVVKWEIKQIAIHRQAWWRALRLGSAIGSQKIAVCKANWCTNFNQIFIMTSSRKMWVSLRFHGIFVLKFLRRADTASAFADCLFLYWMHFKTIKSNSTIRMVRDECTIHRWIKTRDGWRWIRSAAHATRPPALYDKLASALKKMKNKRSHRWKM